MTSLLPARLHHRAGRDLALRASLVAVAAALAAACSGDDAGPGTIRAPETAAPVAARVLYAGDGKLSGGMEGYAWVAAGPEATVAAPSPCNERGCFRDTTAGLCTRGTLPALTCTSETSWDCNYAANWGVVVGLSATAQGGAWGPTAPDTVAVSYAGGPGNYRLTAHVAGDPPEKVYCVDGYPSGLAVSAGRLRSECWGDGGAPLPSFARVDTIGLLLSSAKAPVPFDFCVSTIALGLPADDDRVIIGDNGKLNGAMTGYAWVAGSRRAVIEAPSPCDTSGCFHETGGRLCARGSMPALACTGQGTADLDCDWQANWGAMIGVNPQVSHGAWGPGAPERVAFEYSGEPGSYRLTAHVAGDPDSRTYCIRDYQSGQPVTAGRFKTECWAEAGQVLESFEQVDSFGLLVGAAETPVAFDYCIDAISAE